MIWVKCETPVLIVHVSASGDLLHSFHYSQCWEIADCRVRLYLTAVQFTHCGARSLQSFGLHSRNISDLPCGANKYKHLHCSVYICTVLAHKQTLWPGLLVPSNRYLFYNLHILLSTSDLPLVMNWTSNNQCSYNVLYTYISVKREIFPFQCLVTCGKGYKHRQTWCQFGEDRLDDRLCGSSKPESVQTCQQQECASWQVGPWGQVCVNNSVHWLYIVQVCQNGSFVIKNSFVGKEGTVCTDASPVARKDVVNDTIMLKTHQT